MAVMLNDLYLVSRKLITNFSYAAAAGRRRPWRQAGFDAKLNGIFTSLPRGVRHLRQVRSQAFRGGCIITI